MEEDIKMIEDVLKDKDTKFWIGTQGIQAIENLIARYKELEEGKALTKKQEAMLLKAIKQSAEEQITKEIKNYILKSKVKEKIEKYKLFEWHNSDDKYWGNRIITGIEELLED